MALIFTSFLSSLHRDLKCHDSGAFSTEYLAGQFLGASFVLLVHLALLGPRPPPSPARVFPGSAVDAEELAPDALCFRTSMPV